MPPTISILKGRVGEGGAQFGNEVKRIKQLLRLNGFDLTDDDRWDKKAVNALIGFREKMFGVMTFPIMDGMDSRRDGSAYITPRDPILFELAF
jgi:hypothetical protein